VTNALLLLAAVLATLVALRWRDARHMPPLAPWHRQRLGAEMTARRRHEVTELADYLALEETLFEELRREIVRPPADPGRPYFDRYVEGSLSDPDRYLPNRNRTFVLEPEKIAGAALLLHGLTDSPYSVRALAELLARRGFYVLGLRIPGHGTTPGALAAATRRDWRAAVALAARHVAGRAGDRPYWVGGYSNGGALALDLTLAALDQPALRVPDRLLLLSPAVGVTELALFANWHKALSFLPGAFRKLRWTSIEPEFDPFKYNSFPKNAGDQVHLLTRSVKRRLARRARRGALGGFPPVLTFQSVVDSTVQVGDLVHHLYARLPANGSELVLFDANRWSAYRDFLRAPEPLLYELARAPRLDYRLTVVTNRYAESREVAARSRGPGDAPANETPLGLAWPEQVYSLSHVAIPFRADDPFYGDASANPDGDVYHLGTLAPRGETKRLRLAPGRFLRLRHNPFFPYLEARIAAALTAAGAPAQDAASSTRSPSSTTSTPATER